MMSGWSGLDLLPPAPHYQPLAYRGARREDETSTVTVGPFQGLCPCGTAPVPMGLAPLYLPASLVVVKVHECPAGGGPLASLPDVHKGL